MMEEVKQILFEIITSGGDDEEDQSIKAVQQMGVSLTNAVAKNGVNIIQVQSIVQKKVIEKAVKALQIINSREHEYAYPRIARDDRVPLIVNQDQDMTPDKAFRDFVRAEINDEVLAESFIYRCLQLYINYAIERYQDEATAAKKIGMPLKQFRALRKPKQS